jgi:hypothetical protein
MAAACMFSASSKWTLRACAGRTCHSMVSFALLRVGRSERHGKIHPSASRPTCNTRNHMTMSSQHSASVSTRRHQPRPVSDQLLPFSGVLQNHFDMSRTKNIVVVGRTDTVRSAIINYLSATNEYKILALRSRTTPMHLRVLWAFQMSSSSRALPLSATTWQVDWSTRYVVQLCPHDVILGRQANPGGIWSAVYQHKPDQKAELRYWQSPRALGIESRPLLSTLVPFEVLVGPPR